MTTGKVDAGDFSEWLRGTEQSFHSAKGEAKVPCGTCRGCCRSSMFILIKPEEKKTIARIPGKLLFPAPGLPKGHVLMGYDDQGRCPMLVDNECSIYENRPQTCRDFDCRVFAATSIAVDPVTQAEIANRVKAWAFDYPGEGSREEHRIVKEAAAFLQKNKDLFPPGSLPGYPVQLAVLAITIYRLFGNLTAKKHPPEAAIAKAIMNAIKRREDVGK